MCQVVRTRLTSPRYGTRVLSVDQNYGMHRVLHARQCERVERWYLRERYLREEQAVSTFLRTSSGGIYVLFASVTDVYIESLLRSLSETSRNSERERTHLNPSKQRRAPCPSR